MIWLTLLASFEITGKGELTTFWLGGTGASSVSSATNSMADRPPQAVSVAGDSAAQPLRKITRPKKHVEQPEQTEAASKTARLVDWNVDIMQRLLKQIEARRKAAVERMKKEEQSTKQSPFAYASEGADFAKRSMNPEQSHYHEPEEDPHSEDFTRIYTDEVKEIISLPNFDSRAARKIDNADSIVLSYEVVNQLHDYVTNISKLYNENSFHNVSWREQSQFDCYVLMVLNVFVLPQDVHSFFISCLHSSNMRVT